MATIKHIFKGESLSMLFTFPVEYDMARIQSHGIWIGGTEFTGVIIGQGIELKLTSLQTDLMSGNQRVSLWIDDTILGVRKPYVGDIAVGNTNALPDNESTSEVYDVIVNVDISVTAIEAGDLMFNYVKGDPLTYDDLTPEQIAELQQPATDAIASIQEVELAVETAEELRVQAEINRQTNTATAISNAENATEDANDAAILANEKAGLANAAATNADNARLAIANELALKVDKTAVKQTTGTSTTDVMSQKAVTDKLATVEVIAKATFGVLMPLNPANINFDTVNNQLVISGTNRIVTPRFTITTAPTGTVEMPATNNMYRIEFNPTLSSYEIKLAHAVVVLSNIIIGGYRRSGSRIWTHGIEEYLINGSPYLEDDYDESRGEFFATLGGIINFDTVTQMVEFPVGRIFYKRTYYASPATSVAKTDANNRGKIYYDIDSGEITIVPSTQAGSIPASKIQIGLYDIGNKIFDVSSRVSINGIDITPPLSAIAARGELTSTDEGGVNFDLLNLELSISDRCRVTYGDKTVLTSAQTISLAPAINTWCSLMFDKTSGDFFFLETSNLAFPEGSIQVGRVFLELYRGIPSGLIVLEIGRYSINGVESGISRSIINTVPYIAVNGNTDANYVQPNIDGFEWINNAVSSQMYALYDDLVTQYPDYVTRTLLGNDTIDNPIYRYDFTPPPHSGGRPNYTPKIILTSGHHGYEKAGIYVTYSAMKEICTRWQEDERLETLRWGVHFIVVPVVSPYGFDNNTRVNERGVDPERNYPIGWSFGQSDPTSGQYRGESPLSEPSAQYIDAILSNNRDAIYFCSFHNMSSETNFIWNASATVFGRNLASSLVSRLTGAWNKRFPWATGIAGIGYSDLEAPFGSAAMLSTRVYGIQGGTFEISRIAKMAGDETLWGSLVATLGTEVFINWLLLNLEHGAKFKNSSIRLPG